MSSLLEGAMNPFELSLPTKVLFGVGSLDKLGAEVAPHAKHVLLVSGGNPTRMEKPLASLKAAGVAATLYAVKGEPTLDVVRGGVRIAQKAGCGAVVAVGGGSVMDAAKAIAAMATNPGDLMDYLEVIGSAQPLTKAPLFLVAAPTTAGTGSEATRNAVLTSPEHRVKVSLRHPLMVPRLVLLDPASTATLPPDVTAATGMDALCQLIESYTCLTPNPFTDGLCREGILLVARSLRRAFSNGDDLDARGDMLLAAHFSGQALANAKLGAVHGYTAAIGGMTSATHGALCGALLAAVTDANLKALRARLPQSPAIGRYAEVAQWLTGKNDAVAEDAVANCEKLRQELGIPRLEEQGVKREDFDLIVHASAKASSMKGNPVELTKDEMMTVLVKVY
jgi:alcohol dehydrogenase class IV